MKSCQNLKTFLAKGSEEPKRNDPRDTLLTKLNYCVVCVCVSALGAVQQEGCQHKCVSDCEVRGPTSLLHL